ncbi:MAG: delta-60 repeat domain-containing protein [Anaerolineae bacterium]
MQVFHSARRHGRALAIVAGHVRPFAAALAAVAFLVAAGARSSGPSWLRAGTTQAAAGDLDATFGTGGKQLVPPPAGANGAVSFVLGVGPDGRIWQVSRLTVAGEFRIGVATLDPADGAPLAVAGPDSPYLLPDVPGGSSQIGAIAFQPDGKVVLAGDFTSTGAPAGVHLVVRLTSTGSLDDAPGTGSARRATSRRRCPPASSGRRPEASRSRTTRSSSRA